MPFFVNEITVAGVHGVDLDSIIFNEATLIALFKLGRLETDIAGSAVPARLVIEMNDAGSGFTAKTYAAANGEIPIEKCPLLGMITVGLGFRVLPLATSE